MELVTNLHTHTKRCNHASGTERDYIEAAIAGGIKCLGFADHAPYKFKEGHNSGFRMKPEEHFDYCDSLTALREEYKDRIEIKIGYEAEYYPDLFDEFMKTMLDSPVEYLILGQHFLENEYSGIYSGKARDDEGILKAYVDQVIEGIATGYFSYIAHPDLCYFIGSPAIYDKHYSRLIESAKCRHIPLEINSLGILGNRHYPNERFWQLCGEIGADVCFGSDAHSPDAVFSAVSLEKAEQLIEKYDLRFIPDPEIKDIHRNINQTKG